MKYATKANKKEDQTHHLAKFRIMHLAIKATKGAYR
jgi:hypothetical protein